jgi:uncharacterized protein (DUF4415 family)
MGSLSTESFSAFGRKCSTWNTSSLRLRLYTTVMTSKSKRAKGKKAGLRRGRIARLRASVSVEDELLRLAEEGKVSEARWNRPRKQRISLRVDREVVDWFKSKGPGYQTRINRILRSVMVEAKKRMGEK